MVTANPSSFVPRSLEFAHEVAGEAGEIARGPSVLRRDDDAKLVAVVLAAIEEGVRRRPVLRPPNRAGALATREVPSRWM